MRIWLTASIRGRVLEASSEHLVALNTGRMDMDTVSFGTEWNTWNAVMFCMACAAKSIDAYLWTIWSPRARFLVQGADPSHRFEKLLFKVLMWCACRLNGSRSKETTIQCLKCVSKEGNNLSYPLDDTSSFRTQSTLDESEVSNSPRGVGDGYYPSWRVLHSVTMVQGIWKTVK